MQARFQKERDEQKSLIEQIEQQYEQKILGLEQEIIVVKQHVRNASSDEQVKGLGRELNCQVLEEMDKLEERYRKSEQELREVNQDLRKQLREAQRQARETDNELASLR